MRLALSPSFARQTEKSGGIIRNIPLAPALQTRLRAAGEWAWRGHFVKGLPPTEGHLFLSTTGKPQMGTLLTHRTTDIIGVKAQRLYGFRPHITPK